MCVCSLSPAVAELALSRKGDVYVSWNAEVVVSRCKDRTVTGGCVRVYVFVYVLVCDEGIGAVIASDGVCPPSSVCKATDDDCRDAVRTHATDQAMSDAHSLRACACDRWPPLAAL